MSYGKLLIYYRGSYMTEEFIRGEVPGGSDDSISYVTKDDLRAALEEHRTAWDLRMLEFETRMTALVSTTLAKADIVRHEDMNEAIRAALTDHPSVSETKAMIDGAKESFAEEVRPVSNQLEMISSQLSGILKMESVLQSTVRDVTEIRRRHDEQQQKVSDITSELKKISENQQQVAKILAGEDGRGGIVRDMYRLESNQKAVDEKFDDKLKVMEAMSSKVVRIDEYVGKLEAQEQARLERRQERIEFIKELPSNRKLWAAVGTLVGGAMIEVLNQLGFWHSLFNP
jgi:DNA repair exonuclease SbcCD ATPase subunit